MEHTHDPVTFPEDENLDADQATCTVSRFKLTARTTSRLSTSRRELYFWYQRASERERQLNMALKKVLIFTAIAEAATGLALLIAPRLVGRLLFGEDLVGLAIPVARVTGIALIALGLACWPGPPLAGMLTYSVSVTLYLAYLGIASGLGGALLWPAIVLHVVLSVLLFRALLVTDGR